MNPAAKRPHAETTAHGAQHQPSPQAQAQAQAEAEASLTATAQSNTSRAGSAPHPAHSPQAPSPSSQQPQPNPQATTTAAAAAAAAPSTATPATKKRRGRPPKVSKSVPQAVTDARRPQQQFYGQPTPSPAAPAAAPPPSSYMMIPAYDFVQCIDDLHAADQNGLYLKPLLLQAAQSHPDIGQALRTAYQNYINYRHVTQRDHALRQQQQQAAQQAEMAKQAEQAHRYHQQRAQQQRQQAQQQQAQQQQRQAQARVRTQAPPAQTARDNIDFSPHSQNIWDQINKKYSRLSSSRQYEKAFDVVADIEKRMASICDQAATNDATFATKFSALDTLREIGETIVGAVPDELSHRVRLEFHHIPELEQSMSRIIGTLTPDECRRMCGVRVQGENETFLDKLWQFHGNADGYCVFEGLRGAIEELKSGGDEDEDDDDDEDEDEEDDDEDGVPGGADTAAPQANGGGGKEVVEIEDGNAFESNSNRRGGGGGQPVGGSAGGPGYAVRTAVME